MIFLVQLVYSCFSIITRVDLVLFGITIDS